MSDLIDKDEEFDPVELRKALASSVSDIIHGDQEARRSIATQVVKTLQNRVEQTDLTSLLYTKETYGVNEQPYFELDGELQAYIHTPGSYAPITQPRNKEFTYSSEMISCHIMLPLLQLQSGRYGTIADQISKGQRAIQAQVNKIALDTMIAAVPSTSTLSNYATGAFSQTALNTAINQIEDQAGGARVIVGRRNILSACMEFNQSTTTLDIFPESVKEDIIKRGTFGVYKGLPLVGYKDYKGQDGRSYGSSKDILVIGQDVGRFGWWQEMQSVDDIEVGTLNWHIHAWVLVGAAVFYPEAVYRYLTT